MPPPMFTRPCLQRLTTSNLAYSQHRHLLQTGASSLDRDTRVHRPTKTQSQASSTKAEARQPEPTRVPPRSQLHRRSGGVTGASLHKSTLLLSTLSPTPPPSACSRLLSQVQTSTPLYSTMATPSDPQSAPPAEDTTTKQENGTQESSSDEEYTMPLSKS